MSWLYEYTKHIIGLPLVDSGQCVRLVQHYIPEIGHTSTWEKGDLVLASKKLMRGMAIANFNAQGKWPGRPEGNHAALLWDWGGRHMDTGLVDWIEIVEQFVGLPVISLRRLKREGAGKNPSNNADEFYIIEHKGEPRALNFSRHGPPANHFNGDSCPDRNKGEAVSNENVIRSDSPHRDTAWPDRYMEGVNIVHSHSERRHS